MKDTHFLKLILALYLICLPVWPASAVGTHVPRTVLGLFSSIDDNSAGKANIHQFAEMPLNHLGLKVRPHNIQGGLPDVKNDPEIIGVLAWFQSGTRLPSPVEYLDWLGELVDAGKKVVIMGDPAFKVDLSDQLVPLVYVNRFFRKIGLRDHGEWVRYTYDLEYELKNEKMVEFERVMKGFYPSYDRISPISDTVQSHLVVNKASQPGSRGYLVMTFPQGGYVANGYALYTKYIENKQVRLWYINPFEFFETAFGTEEVPKPDTTTLVGRRIYYSHVDGDGWLDLTSIERYRDDVTLCSEVILEEVIKRYPDLPVSASVVAAEIDPNWAGASKSVRIAREYFRQSQVEIGSHTYSHPFKWEFFEDYRPEKEAPYISRYPNGGWEDNYVTNRLTALFRQKKMKDHSYSEVSRLSQEFYVPRAYAKKPFDLELEIEGSIKAINQLAPPGKEVKILMWTGDTSPGAEVIKRVREAGLKNINGGDSRFDREYPSVAWVSSIGRTVGDELQIYSSNSNENTYTELWQGGFHGFRYLPYTLENTESPRRIKPINLYYHSYSGEYQASLDAVISNLDTILKKPIVPISTSEFCGVAEGFFSTQISKTNQSTWLIEKRGNLQTIRFDRAEEKSVDMGTSKGVLGFNHYQGSLYVFLDENSPLAEITIIPNEPGYSTARVPYLLNSRWRIRDYRTSQRGFQFHGRGWGNPEASWYFPLTGRISITFEQADGESLEWNTTVLPDHILTINNDAVRSTQGMFTITRLEE